MQNSHIREQSPLSLVIHRYVPLRVEDDRARGWQGGRRHRERVGDKLGKTQKNEKRELNRAAEIEKKMHRHIHREGEKTGRRDGEGRK